MNAHDGAINARNRSGGCCNCGSLVAAVVRRVNNGRRIQAWAASNGLEVVRYEERPILRGPFFWISSNYQIVYFVVVRARNGTEKSGFVRFAATSLGYSQSAAT